MCTVSHILRIYLYTIYLAEFALYFKNFKEKRSGYMEKMRLQCIQILERRGWELKGRIAPGILRALASPSVGQEMYVHSTGLMQWLKQCTENTGHMSALGKVSPHIQKCRQWFIHYAVAFWHFGNLLPQTASSKVFTEGTLSSCFYSPRQNVSALVCLSPYTGYSPQGISHSTTPLIALILL